MCEKSMKYMIKDKWAVFSVYSRPDGDTEVLGQEFCGALCIYPDRDLAMQKYEHEVNNNHNVRMAKVCIIEYDDDFGDSETTP